MDRLNGGGWLSLRIIGHRRVDLYCQDGFGGEDRLQKVIRAIQDCAAVLWRKSERLPRRS